MSQKATEQSSEIRQLATTQLIVIEQLLLGKTVTAAAEAAGVCRESVHRWRREDWLFQAELNRRQAEVQAAVHSRLLAMAIAATDTVSQAIAGGNLKASLALLKGLGALAGNAPRVGSDDPSQLKEEKEVAEKERQHTQLLRSISAF